MSKASKHRFCPALGREISRSECGENRQSHYACPPSCAYNPFALENYPALLLTEDALDRRSLEWMFGESRDGARLERELKSALRGESVHGYHALTVWNLFFRRDEHGLTCTQRWAAAKFPGLDNDERVFIQSKMQVRIVLFEVHCVLDDHRIEGIDLLAPAEPPMIIVDRSLAARTSRFATLLGWAYPLPHFWRLSGSAISLPDIDDFEQAEVITETVRHLGGPTEVSALRTWVAEHFVRVDEALMATANERQRLMLAGVDVQLGLALYALEAPFAECRAVLDDAPEIGRDEPTDTERSEGFAEARDWFDDKSPQTTGRKLLGRVVLGQAFWRVEATGAERLAELRKRFEKRLGKRMRFDRERRDDLGSRMAMEIPPPDRALVPTRLLQRPTKVDISTTRLALNLQGGSKADIEAHFMKNYWRDFADQSVPALDGKTPRQATGDPASRKKLLRLLKTLVRRTDEANLRSGRTDNINGVLRDLGLTELDFPPPPVRPVPPDLEDDDTDEELDNEATQRPLEVLPPGQMNEDEVSERMNNALADLDTAAAAMDELAASGSTLLEDMDVLTEGLLSDSESNFFVSFLLHGWFTLVPPGKQAPKLDYEAMAADLARELERLSAKMPGGPDEAMSHLTSGCRQPVLLQFLMAEMLEASAGSPKKMRPKPAARMPMIAALKIMINEVDRALRAR